MTDYKELILNGPKTLSVGEYYLRRFKEHRGDKVAMVQDFDGTELTYSQLLHRGKSVSGYLRSHGIKSTDTVMLCCGNILEFPPIMLGTVFIGAALAPVNPAFHPSDMLHVLGVANPQLVITNELAKPSIKEALAMHKQPVTLLTIEEVSKCWADDSFIESFHLGLVEDTDTHVALVLCSSGTTGKPKGIEATHFRLLSMQYIHLYPEYEPGSEMVILNKVTPFWSQSHYTTMFTLCAGHKMVQTQSFEVENFFKTIQRYKINLCFTTNAELIPIANYPSTEQFDLSSLRDVIFWGSTTTQHIIKMAAEKLRCPITNVYGMAESGGMLRPDYQQRNKPGNVGKLGENMKAKVLDIETGKKLGPNQEGELCFLSWTSFKAYRGNPQATQEMFDEEGYIHTGDLGYYDDDGYFYIVDRIKELFKYKLIHVSPTEIEEVLVQHPAVLEVAVVGIKHGLDCDHATAFVVLHPGASATEDDLVKMVQESLPSYKWLYGGVRFLDELPRTATGKIQTYQLRQSHTLS